MRTQVAISFNSGSFRSFRALFTGLVAVPLETLLNQAWRAEFVGPAWLRASAPASLAMSGLKGWWGKEFDRKGAGANIVLRGEEYRRVLPMLLGQGPSSIDGKPAALVTYPKSARFPWPHICDELRVYEHDALLGMTIVGAPGLRRFAFPFLLHRSQAPDER